MNTDALVYEAKSFYNAYIALEQIQNVPDYGLLLAIPILVNGAFSVELTLKAILTKEKIRYEKEHNLYSLFSLLPIQIQEQIWNYMLTKSPEFGDAKVRRENLMLISDAFVDWRYSYEKALVPAINSRFLSAFANAAIFVMFDLGYNVDLVPTTSEKSDEEIDAMFEKNKTDYMEKVEKYLEKRNCGNK